MTIREQTGCSTFCVPVQYSSFVNSTDLPTCKSLDEHLCANGQIFHYINHQTTRICNSMNSNSKKYYTGLHYFRSELGVDRNSVSLHENNTKGKKNLRIEWKFASNIRMIREEKLVYEGKYLIAWLGGSLSIFIGLSFFDICSQIIDLAIYLCQKRGTNDKKMTSLDRNLEEGNHKLAPAKDKMPCPNCNTQIFTTVQSVRKISQCSVELNCLEEPKVVANEIFGPENFYVQLHDKFARVNHPMKVEACDAEIDNQLYLRSKCKTWASRTRTVCTNLRARLLVLPPGAQVGDEELQPTAGHQSLKSAEEALSDMTKYFRKLDKCNIQIKLLHGYRFLARNYDTETIPEQKTADKERKNLLETEAQVFIDAYTTELNHMQNLIDKLEYKLHQGSQGYSPKQLHLRRKSSPILTQPQVYSRKLPQSRRHSVDVLKKGGFSKIPRHLRRQSMGNIQENV